MTEDNKTRQAEEVEALAAIYENDWSVINEKKGDYSIQIHDGDKKSPWNVTIQFHLPENYPGDSPPHYEMMAPWLKRNEKVNLEAALADIYCENIGESILYLWIEKIREVVTAKSEGREISAGNDSSNIDSTSSPETNVDEEDDVDYDPSSFDFSSLTITTTEQPDSTDVLECPAISHGDPIIDRKSTFQSHLAPVFHKQQVQMVMETLCQNRKFQHATHNITAYRIYENDVFYQGCDDDGETSAGSRLLHLLQILDARNVMVVVSRWYGGIHLGPDRFKHINNAARILLEEHGYISSKQKKGPQTGGKKKK